MCINLDGTGGIGLRHRPQRKANGITKTDKNARKSDDLIKRDFCSEKPLKIWDAFTEQIALYEERAEETDSLSVDERLKLQEGIVKLEKLI